MARTKVTRIGGAKLYRNSNFSTPVSVDASSLRRLSSQLETLSKDQLEQAFGEAHKVTAEYVFGLAVAKAQTRPQTAKVARSAKTFTREVIGRGTGVAGAALRLRGGKFAYGDDRAGNDPGRFAFGAEFGANRNVNRRVPVRMGPITGMGRVKRKPRGRDSDLNFGGFRIMKGWNQFQPWRGGSQVKVGEDIEPGYFMFPAIVEARPKLNDIYGEAALTEIGKRLKG